MEIDADILGMDGEDMVDRQVAVLREQIGRLQIEREQLKATYDKALERANRRIAELEEK